MFDWNELRQQLKDDYIKSPKEETNCLICEGDDYEVWFSDYFRIVRCKGCGLVYPNPRTAKEWLKLGYSSADYGSGPLNYLFYPEGGYWEENYKKALTTAKRIKKLTKGNKLLDVGCLFGALLLAAKEVGFDVKGVEVCKQAVEYGRKEFGLDIIEGDIESCNFSSSFDVITFTDVLDHLSDPLIALREAHRILREGGVVYIQAPDFECRRFRIMGPNAPEVLPGHLCYFTKETIKKILFKAGFHSIATDSVREWRCITLRQVVKKFLPGSSITKFLGGRLEKWGEVVPLPKKQYSTVLEAFGRK